MGSHCCSRGILSIGSLIRFQRLQWSPDLPHSYYFVGLAMKKPQMQVLLRGFLIEGNDQTDHIQVSILDPSSQAPSMVTSQKLFEDILDVAGSIEVIDFAIAEYTVSPFLPLLSVTVTSVSDKQQFQTKTERKRTLAGARVAFGLKETPRRRKRNKNSVTQKGQRNQKQGKSGKNATDLDLFAITDGDIAKQLQQIAKEELASSPSLPSSDSEQSAAESESSVSTDSSSSSDSSSAVEEPLLTGEAADEEKQVQAILTSHRELALKQLEGNSNSIEHSEVTTILRGQMDKDHEEVEGVEQAAECAQQASSSSKEPPPQPPKQSSFCNRGVGIMEAGLQTASKLATCRQCNCKIAKGTGRFSYSFNRSKFAAWVHADCMFSYLRSQKADLSQARRFVDEQLQKTHPSIVTDSLQKLQRDLQST